MTRRDGGAEIHPTPADGRQESGVRQTRIKLCATADETTVIVFPADLLAAYRRGTRAEA